MDGLRIDRVFVSRIEPEEESDQEPEVSGQESVSRSQESVASGQDVTDNVQNSEPSGSDNEQEKFNQ